MPPNGGGGDDGGQRTRSDSPPSSRKPCTSNATGDSIAEEMPADDIGEEGSVGSSHRIELDRTTQNSIRDSASAYSILPGEHTTRREPYDPADSLIESQQDVPYVPSEIPYNSSNLPPNIDIIAEATLVEDHNSTEQNQEQQIPQSNDDTDLDTLGLHWGDIPCQGGVYDDSLSVAISTITTPTILGEMDADDCESQLQTLAEVDGQIQDQTLSVKNRCQQS